MKAMHTLIFLLCITILSYFIAYAYRAAGVCRQTMEGYRGPVSPVQGTFPQAVQVSAIPRDSASATTANPQLAKPDYRDWMDARDSFIYFLEIYNTNTVPPQDREAIGAMLLAAPLYLNQIEMYILKPEAVPSRDILEKAKEARAYADTMRRVGPVDPDGTPWECPKNTLSASDM